MVISIMESKNIMKKRVLTSVEKQKNRNSYESLSNLNIVVRSFDEFIDTNYITSEKTVISIPKEDDVRNDAPFKYDSNFNVDRSVICVCTGSAYKTIGLKVHEEDFRTLRRILKEWNCDPKKVLRTKEDAFSYYYFVFRVTDNDSRKLDNIETVTTVLMSKKITIYYNNGRIPISGYIINKNNNKSYISPYKYINPCYLPSYILFDILHSLKKEVIKDVLVTQNTIQEVNIETNKPVDKKEEAFQLFNEKILNKAEECGANTDPKHIRAVFNCICDRTAMAIPRLYKELYPDHHIYDGARKEWYSINKYGVYKKDTEELLSARMRITTELSSIFSSYMYKYLNTLEGERKEAELKNYTKICSQFPALSTKKTVVEQLKELYVVKNLFSKMNPNKYLFAFENGVYDLRTFQFRRATREDRVFETNGYSYSPSKKNHRKLVKDTIKDMFMTEELYNYFMTIISLRLVRINELEEFYFLIGNASNGKGLITSLIQETFGNYSQVLESSSFYKSKHGVSPSAATPELASTKDSNIVFVNELDRETRLTAAMVKKLSGNDKIKVRFLRQDCFEFIPGYSLFFVSNHEPNIDGDDFGIQRRLKFIPFNVTFKDNPTLPNEKKVNRELKQLFKQTEYCCAFFDVLVKFYNRYITNNKVIVVPEEVKIKSKKYLDCNDPVKQFVTKCIEITNNENDCINAKRMMDIFSNHNGGMRGYKPGILKIRLQQDFGIKWKKTASSNVYIGIREKEANTDI